MARYWFQLQVRPERLGEYKERHRAVWPEMLAALRETGWRSYSLFLRHDGLLIAFRAGGDGRDRGQRSLAGGDGAVLRRSGRPPGRGLPAAGGGPPPGDQLGTPPSA